MSGELDHLFAAVRELQTVRLPGEAEWELKTLRAIEQWALKQQPFKVGDQVQMKPGYTVPASSHGWIPWADLLTSGVTGTVREVGYNAHHGYWYFTVGFPTDDGERLFSHHASNLVAVPA